LFLCFASEVHAQTGGIEVNINGVRNSKGKISIGLFNKANKFPEEVSRYKGIIMDIKGKSVRGIFSNIPNGTYAIAIFHDENNNRKLDKNIFGIPNEGYGFSNNATAIFGPPTFDQAKFKINGTYSTEVKIQY
jgi:uncharacterized protein (DUF2141 family)